METTLAVSLDCDLRRGGAAGCEDCARESPPHAEKSPALFDEATKDRVLGIEGVPAEASSCFTKPQEQ